MSIYIERYNKRGKCNSCNDLIWTENDLQSVYCACFDASIKDGVVNNCTSATDEEMILYLQQDLGNEKTIIIQQI